MGADDGRRRLYELLLTQAPTRDITYEQVAQADRREDLGISSLNIILILVNYISERTNNAVEMRPEWVSRLGDVDGIVSVIGEIDDSRIRQTQT